MNVSVIYKMFQDSESTGRYRFGGKKPINGDKRRRCEEYALKTSNYVRRKQQKVRHDTWRREEINNEKDETISNMHYANFLGDKYGDHGAPYNASSVNVKFCDCMREEDNTSLTDTECYNILAVYPETFEQNSLNDCMSELSLGSSYDEEEHHFNMRWVDELDQRAMAQYKAQEETKEYDDDDINWRFPIEDNCDEEINTNEFYIKVNVKTNKEY